MGWIVTPTTTPLAEIFFSTLEAELTQNRRGSHPQAEASGLLQLPRWLVNPCGCIRSWDTVAPPTWYLSTALQAGHYQD